MKAKDIMNIQVVTAGKDNSLEQCARRMLEFGIVRLPAVNDVMNACRVCLRK